MFESKRQLTALACVFLAIAASALLAAFMKGVFDDAWADWNEDTGSEQLLIERVMAGVRFRKAPWSLLVAVASYTAFAATVMYSARITSLDTHVSALHLLYVHDSMPLCALEERHEVFRVKLRRPCGRLFRYNVYRSFSDGSIDVEEDPLLMWQRGFLCC